MEPITQTIIAALTSGIHLIGNEVAKDAYHTLKKRLLNSLPKNNQVAEVIEKLEQTPESKPLQERLNTELATAKVADNSEVVALLQTLIEQMKQSENGKAALSKFNIQAEKIVNVGETITMGNINL